MTVSTIVPEYGGSSTAVRYHYDVNREFYRLWLDDTMSYSCALWSDGSGGEDLHQAQKAKIDHHLSVAKAQDAKSLLDIGCGWGGLLKAASSSENIEAIVGLTLSEDQTAYVKNLELPNTKVLMESWAVHKPELLYDSIISIGALEHFAKPEDSSEEKVEIYRDFFTRCESWLSPGGRMSLQTIAYGSMRNEDASEFINNEIFPSADLPRLAEIAKAADGLLEVMTCLNHRLHYAKTFETWARNLKRKKGDAVELVGAEITERYERYLTQSAIGFYSGKISLLRIGFRSCSDPTDFLIKP